MRSLYSHGYFDLAFRDLLIQTGQPCYRLDNVAVRIWTEGVGELDTDNMICNCAFTESSTLHTKNSSHQHAVSSDKVMDDAHSLKGRSQRAAGRDRVYPAAGSRNVKPKLVTGCCPLRKG